MRRLPIGLLRSPICRRPAHRWVGGAATLLAAALCASSLRIASMADSKGFGVVPDVGGRHRRPRIAQLIAQHLAHLVEDAFAPSHALEIAFSQSAPQDRVVIRHFSRDCAAPCGNVVGVRVLRPHSINLSARCEAWRNGQTGVPLPIFAFRHVTSASPVSSYAAGGQDDAR